MAKPKLISIASHIEINIPIQIVPKSRPKFNRKTGNAYMPTHYKENQTDIIYHALPQFLDSLASMNLDPQKFTIGRCALTILYYGHARGDSDNISGSIMDAFVKAGILENDNVNTVHELHFAFGGSRDENESPCAYVDLKYIDLRPI